jgi:alpha-1,2-mannosyltransferase
METRQRRGKTEKGRGKEQQVSQTQVNTRLSSYTPNLSVALGLLATIRLLSALYNLVADCDETFNYWEPTHYLMYGYGFQTWEYR